MRNNYVQSQWAWSHGTWNYGDFLSLIMITLALSSFLWKPTHSATECTKKKYYLNIIGMPLNATIQCPMYFQWTVNEYCCYSKYDRFDNNPFCCYSDTYKLVLAVGLICLVLLGSSSFVFFCWAYNIPHHVLRILTCGQFNLNNWMKKNMIHGPYVDPSFYSGEPFWSRGASGLQPYPLRPMPPRIFYPAAPASIKFGWDGYTPSGQMPLFIVASRQFTRNPYSARPSDRSLPSILTSMQADSRRSSAATLAESNNRLYPMLDFHVNMDEMEAAAELLEALKAIEDKGEKSFRIPLPAIPDDIPEESLTHEQSQQSTVVETMPGKHNNLGINNENELSIIAFNDKFNLQDAMLLKDIEDEFLDDATTHPIAVSLTDDDLNCELDLHCSMTENNRIQRGNSVESTDVIYNIPIGETADEESSVPEPIPDENNKTTSTSKLMTTRPSTAASLGEEALVKELNRVDIPYKAAKLPGTIPENSAA